MGFFETRCRRYKGLSRTQLEKVDPSLYHALKISGQLELVIPEKLQGGRKKGSFTKSQEEIDRILAAHPAFKGNPTEAAKHLPWARKTLVKYWVAHDLEVRGANRRIFNGNPLAVFRAHPEKYSGLSRSGLVDVDYGMYRALLRADQMDQAIPEKRRSR